MIIFHLISSIKLFSKSIIKPEDLDPLYFIDKTPILGNEYQIGRKIFIKLTIQFR